MTEHATYEEYLKSNERLISPFKGTSMMPLLKQGRDVFVVQRKGEERFQKCDVVLYRRPPKSYVLHRIIAVREQDYVILGDNCIRKEYGITDDDILGVMVGYVRKGKERWVTDCAYRIYSFVWMHTSALRILWLRLRGVAARAFRKLFPNRNRA